MASDDFDRRDDRDAWDDRDDSGPDRTIRDARAKVAGPGIGLIVVGALSLVSVLIGLVQVLTVGLGAQFDEQRAKIDQDPNMPPQQRAQMKEFLDTYERVLTVALPPMYLIASVLGVVTILAGVRMRQLRSRGLAVTMSVLNMVPCISGCCLVGLPIGIWALVVLSDRTVKRGFELTARRADGRAELE